MDSIKTKHAYLVMAHGNWRILEKQLKLLDSNKNDFFIHIDAKSENVPDFSKVLFFSRYTQIPSQNVFWADYSQIDVTLKLLKKAKSVGGYSYYHLLSGTDLPIKTSETIFDFFESSNKEFVAICPKEVYYSVRRVRYYHLFLHNNLYRNSFVLKGLDRAVEIAQKIFGINRLKKKHITIVDGWTWFSITNSFCQYVLENEDKIRRMFNYTIAADEMFMQTLIFNSPLYNTIYDSTDLKNGSMRYIDWKRGKPYVWGQENGDFEILMNSPYMFARKFDEKYYKIVEQIYDGLKRGTKHDE